MDLAADIAHDDDFASGDIGFDGTFFADRYAVGWCADGALDGSIDIDGIGSGDFALDANRFADHRVLVLCRRLVGVRAIAEVRHELILPSHENVECMCRGW